VPARKLAQGRAEERKRKGARRFSPCGGTPETLGRRGEAEVRRFAAAPSSKALMAALGFEVEKGGGGLRRKAKNTGEAINRGGRGSLECAPRQGTVGRARPGLPELECRSGGRKGTGPTGGARLSARRGGGADLGRERKVGRREGEFGPREKKEKRRWLGRLG
jgi:hypothetical protein